MIVFDVSSLVGAAIRRDDVPELALHRALRIDQIAVSEAVIAELLDVFARPRLQRFLNNGGTLEKAVAMANHASTRVMQLYDRRQDDIRLDEVERIRV